MTDDTIRLERRIAASPAAVFRYLTEAALWARWQGESVELEPAPGGRFSVRMAGGNVVEGSVVEVQRDTRVVVTWGWHDHPRLPPGASTVEFELEPDGDGTMLRLTHRGLPPDEVPLHREGWSEFVPRLALAAEGEEPGPSPP